jgi:hypothetical protein
MTFIIFEKTKQNIYHLIFVVVVFTFLHFQNFCYRLFKINKNKIVSFFDKTDKRKNERTINRTNQQ